MRRRRPWTDEEIDEADRFEQEVRELRHARDRAKWIGHFEALERVSKCPEHRKAESPIEQIMSIAFRRAWPEIPLRAQVVIGPYRVDFLVGEHTVVECDGKEFHSSELQVARDAKRDAWFTARGYTVYRLTGADIHRDEDGCVRRVIGER